MFKKLIHWNKVIMKWFTQDIDQISMITYGDGYLGKVPLKNYPTIKKKSGKLLRQSLLPLYLLLILGIISIGCAIVYQIGKFLINALILGQN